MMKFFELATAERVGISREYSTEYLTDDYEKLFRPGIEATSRFLITETTIAAENVGTYIMAITDFTEEGGLARARIEIASRMLGNLVVEPLRQSFRGRVANREPSKYAAEFDFRFGIYMVAMPLTLDTEKGVDSIARREGEKSLNTTARLGYSDKLVEESSARTDKSIQKMIEELRGDQTGKTTVERFSREYLMQIQDPSEIHSRRFILPALSLGVETARDLYLLLYPKA